MLQVHHSQLLSLTNKLMSLMSQWKVFLLTSDSDGQPNKQFTKCQLSRGSDATWSLINDNNKSFLNQSKQPISFYILTPSHSNYGNRLFSPVQYKILDSIMSVWRLPAEVKLEPTLYITTLHFNILSTKWRNSKYETLKNWHKSCL